MRLIDPNEPSSTYLVIRSSDRELIAVCETDLEVYRWQLHDDGWRVYVRTARCDNGLVESAWEPMAITVFPRPTEQACDPPSACGTHGRCWTHSTWEDPFVDATP